MNWSLRLATIRGITLKVHLTFAFIVLLAAANWAAFGPAGMAFGVGLVLLLFACVTLHEFGHALAAQSFGIPVKEMVLLPIGGIAFLGRATRRPFEELMIAAAGPAVNVVIVALLAPIVWLAGDGRVDLTPALLRPDGAPPSLLGAVQWLVGANIGLVLFNMIPAFPLDGGRILRGLLGLLTDWSRATRWATATGQLLAMGMGGWGLLSGQLTLVLLSALIFFSASSTAAEERGYTVLSSHQVGDACNRHALVLSEHDRVSTVVSYILTSYQPDFAVVRGAELLGVVRRAQVVQSLVLQAGDPPVSGIMSAVPRVDARHSLADVRQAMTESGAPVAAVFDRTLFIGLVSLEDIAEAETVLAYTWRLEPPLPGVRPASRWNPAEA